MPKYKVGDKFKWVREDTWAKKLVGQTLEIASISGSDYYLRVPKEIAKEYSLTWYDTGLPYSISGFDKDFAGKTLEPLEIVKPRDPDEIDAIWRKPL